MAKYNPVNLAFSLHKPAGEVDKHLSPIIYLHGVTDHKGAWEDIPQVVANATKRIAFNLDARSHGESEWCEEFNFDTNADDVIHFMDTMGIEKAILVGHSMGGITAIKTALRVPDRVEKIVAEDMVVRKLPQPPIDIVLDYIKLLREAIGKVSTDLDEEKAKVFIMKYINNNKPSEMKSLISAENDGDPTAGTSFLSLRRDADGRYKLKCNLDVIERSMRCRDTLTQEPEGVFQGPACFIYGKQSLMQVGSDEHHIKQYFPNSEFHGVDEGHNIHNMKPSEFTEILLKFIS